MRSSKLIILALGLALGLVYPPTATRAENGDEPSAERAEPAPLDSERIGQAAETEATVTEDGVVRIGWVRDDVNVTVDGTPFPPAAGLGSWAAFQTTDDDAIVMGDTVVFQDEVTPAMDAAFANDLQVTALHNHFFYDQPKVYFMHIAGRGLPGELAAGVKAVWDAIREVRAENPQPADRFPAHNDDEETPEHPGDELDPERIGEITGLEPSVTGGVIKVAAPREGQMHGTTVGGAMGLTTRAAFTGTENHATIDGDFIMTAEEVQTVLKVLRQNGIHIVALHNHMIGEQPAFYFAHYWGTGPADQLARAFRAARVVQADASEEEEETDE